MLHLNKHRSYELIFICVRKCFYSRKNNHRPDLHSLPAGTHIFAEHDVVEGGRTNEKEHLLDGLFDEALLHAVLAHGGVEDAELLNDGGDGVRLRVLVDAVGTLPEARRLHAGNPL